MPKPLHCRWLQCRLLWGGRQLDKHHLGGPAPTLPRQSHQIVFFFMIIYEHVLHQEYALDWRSLNEGWPCAPRWLMARTGHMFLYTFLSVSIGCIPGECLLTHGFWHLGMIARIFFFAGIFGQILWRVQSRHKCQRWPSWHCCMLQSRAIHWVLLAICYQVLVMCAFSQIFQEVFLNRDFSRNKITGTIPCQISLLTALQLLYTLHNQFLMSVGLLAS